VTNLKKFEKLSQTNYGIIRNLIVEEGLVANSQIEQIIEQVTIDRFNLGKAKVDFARTLDRNNPEACKVIITLCYYAMYQSCRAAVFHVHRNDVDAHDKVAIEIGKLIGDFLEKALTFWRNTRNEVDYSPYPVFPDPLEQLASKAVDATTSCLAEIENFLKKRGVKL
jgi:CMP-2-keto-3-deoxyoctulosonic acid synthetase